MLDEADRMLDMGFIHDIRKVLALLPAARQNLLFSATFSSEIRALADKLLDHPVPIEVAARNTLTELVEQVVHPVDKARKRDLLSYLIGSNNWRQVLVFTRTKHGANRLAQQLEHDGLSAAAIHGNKSQGARTRALAGFRTAPFASWWRPTSRRADWTSISCRTWSTSSCRTWPRIMSIDRAHRARRQRGRGDVAGVRRRAGPAARHRSGCSGARYAARPCLTSDTDPCIAAEPIQNGRGNAGRRPQVATAAPGRHARVAMRTDPADHRVTASRHPGARFYSARTTARSQRHTARSRT